MSSRGKTALIILDMINNFDFPEARQLLTPAVKAAEKIQKLKVRFVSARLPVIYVNDNLGKWKSDWQRVFDICAHQDCKGKRIANLLKPNEEDYFILKPKHSGFYLTSLELLLDDLRVKTLVITGIAGNICVLFTANDAHMRGYRVIVPRDCIASNSLTDNQYAVKHLDQVLKIKTPLSTSLKF